VRPEPAQRTIGLAALALIAGLIALAVARNGSNSANNDLPPGGGRWYSALAAPAPLQSKSRRTACGQMLDAKTVGVAHPVLPCNVKVYIEYGDKRVLTAVIDRGRDIAGPEFHLTKALADEVGLHGTQPIRWRYATDTAAG
jgi:rare lipoprotein A (peptidoglycan hydrolase)